MKTNETIRAAVLAAMLSATGLPAAADCVTSITETAPDSRYTIHDDETVTDNVTGLMWKRCSESQTSTSMACDTDVGTYYTWQAALQQAEAVRTAGFAGYDDWRLPNRNELASLLEEACSSPSINITVFPYTRSSNYWSSSPYAGNPNSAWYVSTNFGSELPGLKSNGNSVRLVRGRLVERVEALPR